MEESEGGDSFDTTGGNAKAYYRKKKRDRSEAGVAALQQPMAAGRWRSGPARLVGQVDGAVLHSIRPYSCCRLMTRSTVDYRSSTGAYMPSDIGQRLRFINYWPVIQSNLSEDIHGASTESKSICGIVEPELPSCTGRQQNIRRGLRRL